MTIKPFVTSSRKYLLFFCGGALSPMGFAPSSNLFLLALSLGIFFYPQPKSKAFLIGFAWGIGYFSFGVYWIFNAVAHYSSSPLWLSLIITIFFILLLTLFPAAVKYIQSRFVFNAYNLVLIAACWTVFEFIRSNIMSGFPWLLIGDALTGTLFDAFHPLFGSLFSGFIFVLLVLITVHALHKKNKPSALLLAVAMAGIIPLYFLANYSWTKPSNQTLDVAIVQTNHSQSINYQNKNLQTILDNIYHFAESTLKDKKVDLVLFPETAIPQYLSYSSIIINKLKKLLSYNQSLITGVFIDDDEGVANGLIMINQTNYQYYKKQELVPFGEYWPTLPLVSTIAEMMNIPMSNLVKGEANQPLLTHNSVSIMPTICYDVAFTQLVRRSARSSNMIISLSNDSWFGQSNAPWQHLQIAATRARESSKPMIRSTTNGISAVISHRGETLYTSPAGKKIVHRTMVQLQSGSTLYNGIGLYLGWVIILFLSIISKYIEHFRQRTTVSF